MPGVLFLMLVFEISTELRRPADISNFFIEEQH